MTLISNQEQEAPISQEEQTIEGEDVSLETDKDILVNDKEEPVTEGPPEQANSIRGISGFVEVLTSAPTHAPKGLYDQMKIYDGALYIYDYVNQSWISANAKMAAGYETRASSAGTGTVTITCGFRPRLIKINAFCSLPGGWTGWSVGHATSDSDSMCLGYAYSGTVWESLYSSSKIIFVWNNGETLNTQAEVSAISATGFTLNFTAMGVDVRYSYEAFG